MEELKYLGVLFTFKGKMEKEFSRRNGEASEVMQMLKRSAVVKAGFQFVGQSMSQLSLMVMSSG